MADVAASIRAIRALGALFLIRALRPIAILVVILLAAAYILVIMLSLSFGSWWLLSLLLLVPVTSALALVAFGLWYFTQRILPRKLTKQEREQLNGFTDKLFGVAEKTRTPYPIILVLIAKDVLRGRESSFLSSMIGDSRSLLKEFSSIQRMFSS